MNLRGYTKKLVALPLLLCFSSQVYSIEVGRSVTICFPKQNTVFLAISDTLNGSTVSFPSDHNPAYHGKTVEEEGAYIISDHNPAHKIILEERESQDLDDFLNYPDLPGSGFHIPRMDIHIDGGTFVADKKTFLKALIKIDGGGFYPDLIDSVWIRGRGNSTWNADDPYDKNPYRLKFRKEVSPFGLAKGKNWILLTNKERHSLMANAIGMKVAQLVQLRAANHIIPIDLFINGEYRGNYNFTEKVGLYSNSVKLTDRSRAALLELDTYFDETYKFHSSCYHLPVNIKDHHFKKGEKAVMLSRIQTEFDRLCSMLQNEGKISQLVDVDQLARYLMVNELIGNYEIMHPKSLFLYREDFASSNSKFIFGPVWDLNWTFGYEQNRDYGTTDPEVNFGDAPAHFENRQFINDLLFKDESVYRAYCKVWKDFMEHHLQTLLDYCDNYYRYTKDSFLRNADKWNDGGDYHIVVQNMKNWLERRARYIYSHLNISASLLGNTSVKAITSVNGTPAMNEYEEIYDLQGFRKYVHMQKTGISDVLSPGIYIVGGKKIAVINR